MLKKIFCIYRVDHKGKELGYMRRIEIDDSDGRLELRTTLVNGYSSYAYSVIGRMCYYYKIDDDFDLTLVDEYEEYTL